MLIGQDTELRYGWGTANKSMFICSYVESTTETSVEKAKDYIGRGDTAPTFRGPEVG